MFCWDSFQGPGGPTPLPAPFPAGEQVTAPLSAAVGVGGGQEGGQRGGLPQGLGLGRQVQVLIRRTWSAARPPFVLAPPAFPALACQGGRTVAWPRPPPLPLALLSLESKPTGAQGSRLQAQPVLGHRGSTPGSGSGKSPPKGAAEEA
jgi:hypothetical protein